MRKVFNTTGLCVPRKHYMVNIENKLRQIKKLVDAEAYFTINRGRQYGKTTTLSALRRYLVPEYIVIPLSFESFDEESFSNVFAFCQKFLKQISTVLKKTYPNDNYYELWLNPNIKDIFMLNQHISNLCQNKKIVLIIDEVDKASNYRVFLDFLSMLRSKFLARVDDLDTTFHSVILSGVYDIKNIKLKMVAEGLHDFKEGEKIHNSPWNIATAFEVEMSFSTDEIKTMLIDYEKENHTGMDIDDIAESIFYFTFGYPVLVSRVCWYLDTKINDWSVYGVGIAVSQIVREVDNELFKSLSQNLENYEDVSNLLYDVLILGERRSFSIANPTIELAFRYGYIKSVNDRIKISNKIFESVISNYFISKNEAQIKIPSNDGLINEITRNGSFNMELCLERFAIHWKELYSEKETKFMESHCRKIFLTYLKPILNGQGFYFIESALTDDRRMDLIVVFKRQRFVLELKIWKGTLYNEAGVSQLLGYMGKLDEEKGYLLTFDFRQRPEIIESQWRVEGNKKVFEVRV